MSTTEQTTTLPNLEHLSTESSLALLEDQSQIQNQNSQMCVSLPVSQSKIEIQNSKMTSGPLTDSLTHSLETPHGSYRVKEERALVLRHWPPGCNENAGKYNPFGSLFHQAPVFLLVAKSVNRYS